MSTHNLWDDYRNWLCRRVGFNRLKLGGKTYNKLMDQLHYEEFECLIERDNNRALDGVSLRNDFFDEIGLQNGSFFSECSCLELLVGLAIRIDNEYIGDPAEEHPEVIFWRMLCNLKLDRFDDSHYNTETVYDILDKWIYRKYSRNGVGSIFPVRNPEIIMPDVEIWSQMNAYLKENYY